MLGVARWREPRRPDPLGAVAWSDHVQASVDAAAGSGAHGTRGVSRVRVRILRKTIVGYDGGGSESRVRPSAIRWMAAVMGWATVAAVKPHIAITTKSHVPPTALSA